MPRARVKPDAEAVAVAVLKADAALLDLLTASGAATPADHVGTELPGPLPLPFVRAWRVGGAGTGPAGHIDRARLQVDAWAATKATASDVAREALRALLEAPSSAAVPAGVVVTDAAEDGVFAWAPDITTDTPRYLFGVILTAHSTAP